MAHPEPYHKEKIYISQSAITCSKLTIETLEQGEICSKLTAGKTYKNLKFNSFYLTKNRCPQRSASVSRSYHKALFTL